MAAVAMDAVVVVVVEGVVMVRGDVETHPAQDQSVVESWTAAFQAHREVFEDGHDEAGGGGTGREEPGEGREGDQSIHQSINQSINQ